MSAVPRSGPLSARVLCSVEEVRGIRPEWRALFSRSLEATPFQHPDWLLQWIDAFAPRDLFGIEVRKDSRLVGFAPLLIYPRGEERVLAFAGGGVSDYLGVLSESGLDDAVTRALLDCTGTIPGWTVLDLTDLPGASPVLRSERLARYAREHDVCFVLKLPEMTDELTESLSKRQWANLRNARSRTRREGRTAIEQAEPDTVLEFLDDLFRLHTIRWNELGQQGVLADSRLQGFHRAVAPLLISAGLLHLYRFRLNDRTLAVVYSLFHQRTAFCYLQGFDPEFSHLSPGTQLMFSVMEQAVKLGMRSFDFLRGDEPYKLKWNPSRKPSYRAEVPRSALRAGAVISARVRATLPWPTYNP